METPDDMTILIDLSHGFHSPSPLVHVFPHVPVCRLPLSMTTLDNVLISDRRAVQDERRGAGAVESSDLFARFRELHDGAFSFSRAFF